MVDQRQHPRINCESHCMMVEPQGTIYRALLEDISLGGALIVMNNGAPKSLNVGVECELIMCNDLYTYSAKHLCKIVWRDHVNIGVNFQNIHYLSCI
jgi:c-di-GMP-binding flagellar brake protein YcgR